MENDTTFYVCVHAISNGENETGLDGYEGAYISCWIKVENNDDAVATACAGIFASGWCVESVEDVFQVNQDDYKSHKSGEYYRQAQIDGSVYIYYCYPAE